jgi:hypothetical protein
MGAGAINPFYTPTRSRPMSHFVDESIPTDLMLKAGLAKQGQYNEMQDVLNVLGAYDQESLKGGDTAYVDKTKKDIAEFAETMFGTDLTIPENQRNIYKFATRIRSDKKLRQIQANWDNVKDYKERLEELGSKAFSPAVRKSNALISSYIASGKQGEDLGDLHLEEALNLHAKEQEYYTKMKANAGEEFTDKLNGIKGLYGKIGWKNISGTRLAQQALNAVGDYAQSPEGQQAAQIYEELVRTNTLPEGVNSLGEYLVDRLLRTASEFETYENSLHFNKGFHKIMSGGDADPSPDPLYQLGTTIEGEEGSLAEWLKKAANEDGKYTKAQVEAAKSLLARNRMEVSNSNKGIAIQEAIDIAVGNIPATSETAEIAIPTPSADEIFGYNENEASATGVYKNFLTRYTSEVWDNIPKEDIEGLKKLSAHVHKIMPDVIKKAAEDYNEEFFEDLSERSLFTITGDNKLKIGGTDTEIDLAEFFTKDGKPNPDSWALRPNYISEGITRNPDAMRVAIASLDEAWNSDNVWKKDAIDKLATRVGQYRDLLEKNIDGTTVLTGGNWRVAGGKDEETINKAVKNILRSSEILNQYEVSSGEGTLKEAAPQLAERGENDNVIMQDLLSNAQLGDFSFGVLEGRRGLSVTLKVPRKGIHPERQITVQLREKDLVTGETQRSQALDQIYNSILGEGSGELAGATNNFQTRITAERRPIDEITGRYRPYSHTADHTARLKEGQESTHQYIIGNNRGDYELRDIMPITLYSSEGQDSANKTAIVDFQELARNTFVQEAAQVLPGVAVNTLYGFYEDLINNKVKPNSEIAQFIDAVLNRKLSAANYNDVVTYTQLISYIGGPDKWNQPIPVE